MSAAGADARRMAWDGCGHPEWVLVVGEDGNDVACSKCGERGSLTNPVVAAARRQQLGERRAYGTKSAARWERLKSVAFWITALAFAFLVALKAMGMTHLLAARRRPSEATGGFGES